MSRRLLVVSHPCVVAENQSVYLELSHLGWDVAIVVPDRWRHEYRSDTFPPRTLHGLDDRLVPIRILLPGRPQRHVYMCRPSRVLRRFAPEVVFLEQEPFSIPAMQWGYAASSEGIPFGVQADENLDRPFPLPARLIRHWTLGRARFVAARSPSAANLVGTWGAVGNVAVVPHAVPSWGGSSARAKRNGRLFTVGFAGRLVPEKGVRDLVEAVRRLNQPVRLLFVGDGPLRDELLAQAGSRVEIEVRTGVGQERMPEMYSEMDILVLPSRTTRRWAEQFGRVLVEALSCGVPVVGSSSGEIPWVVSATRGGIVVDEGDVRQLTDAISTLKRDPARSARLAGEGRESVDRLFSARAAAQALAEIMT